MSWLDRFNTEARAANGIPRQTSVQAMDAEQAAAYRRATERIRRQRTVLLGWHLLTDGSMIRNVRVVQGDPLSN